MSISWLIFFQRIEMTHLWSIWRPTKLCLKLMYNVVLGFIHLYEHIGVCTHMCISLHSCTWHDYCILGLSLVVITSTRSISPNVCHMGICFPGFILYLGTIDYLKLLWKEKKFSFLDIWTLTYFPCSCGWVTPHHTNTVSINWI